MDRIDYAGLYDEYLGPDYVLPEQIYGSRARSAEHNLASAVYQDAVDILTGRVAAKRYQWDRDKLWLESNEDHPYSFIWCCGVLDLNHHGIRRVVLNNLREPYKRKPQGGVVMTDAERLRTKKMFEGVEQARQRGYEMALAANPKLTSNF